MPVNAPRKGNTRNRWEVTIPLGKRGKKKTWIVRGTRKEALAFEATKLLELHGGKNPLSRAPSFSEYCVNQYKTWADIHIGRDNWEKSRRYVVATLCEHFGDLPIDSITPFHVQKYQVTRLRTRVKTTRKDGESADRFVSPSAVNNELKIFKAILNRAIKQRLPAVVPQFENLDVPEHEIQAWTSEQVDAILDAAWVERPELLPMLVFMINTGVRSGEAIAARWSWVDLQKGVVRIPATSTKSRRFREIPISDELMLWLRGRDGKLITNGSLYIHTRADGKPYKTFPKKKFAHVLEKAGVTGTPHVTRHTFASLFLATREDIWLLSRYLGHKKIELTNQRYSHMLPSHIERGRNAVNIRSSVMASEWRAAQKWSKR